MLVQPTQYIYPPRTQAHVPFKELPTFAEMGFSAQLKYNDSRCLIKILPNTIELWNRHGEKFRTYTPPQTLYQQLHDLRTRLNINPNSWALLDGGLIDQKHPAIKDTIAIWDILVLNGQHLLGTTYTHRYNLLYQHLISENCVPSVSNNQQSQQKSPEKWYYNPTHLPPKHQHSPIDLGWKIDTNILMPENFPAKTQEEGDKWAEIWTNRIEIANKPYSNNSPVLEGLVLKMGTGELELGYTEKNNASWMIRSRVATGRHRF